VTPTFTCQHLTQGEGSRLILEEFFDIQTGEIYYNYKVAAITEVLL
jgi:hypothetical protein